MCVSRSWWRRTSEGRREGGREQQGELDRPRQQNNENMKSRTNSTVKTTRIQSQPKATPEAKRKRQATKLQAEIRGGEAPTPTDRLGNRNDDPRREEQRVCRWRRSPTAPPAGPKKIDRDNVGSSRVATGMSSPCDHTMEDPWNQVGVFFGGWG